MGTRGIVGFVSDGNVLTQYQQFDSYPSGVGVDVLEFARKIGDVEALKEQVAQLTVVPQDGTPTGDELAALAQYHEQVSTGSDWYAALRKTQGRLDLILESGYLVDAGDFWQDSLFCEWGYLVDLDERTLEVYRGFQANVHSKGRFANDIAHEGYYPIALDTVFSLSDLPTDEEFVKIESAVDA